MVAKPVKTMSTSSTTSPAISSSASMAGLATSFPINHVINIKLDKENYLLWKAQFLPYLRSSQLIGYVDGSLQCPSRMITATTDFGASQTLNPAYLTWYDQDQMVLSRILSSLTKEMLAHVMNMMTTYEAWTTLEHMFMSRSQARVVPICMQLVNLKKKDLCY